MPLYLIDLVEKIFFPKIIINNWHLLKNILVDSLNDEK